jgi:hypothetical protein
MFPSCHSQQAVEMQWTQAAAPSGFEKSALYNKYLSTLQSAAALSAAAVLPNPRTKIFFQLKAEN